MAASHSRSSSQVTNPENMGNSYNLILDHILSYPGTYEIPLRTMYTLNCAPRAQPLPQDRTPLPQEGTVCTGYPRSPNSSSNNSSPTSTQFSQQDARLANTQFASSLMAQISQMPPQQCSLPPSFISSFAHRCFPLALEQVDFPQALTALDYLRDLERRRTREKDAALQRLGVKRNSDNTLSHDDPNITSWFADMESKEQEIEKRYARLYLGVRRWILINEMLLEPFNWNNCIAMLNTLYPPVTSSPAYQLAPNKLEEQRKMFLRYMHEVKENGSKVLIRLIDKEKRDGDPNGWGAVARTVEEYVRVACASIEKLSSAGITDGLAEGKISRRKVDSGVSFGSSNKSVRPETRDGSALSRDKTKSPPAIFPATSRNPSTTPSSRGGSTLERIARELRRMGRRNKLVVEEIINKPEELVEKSESPLSSQTKLSRSRSFRRMKSFGALGELRSANASTVSVANTASIGRSTGDAPSFDKYEMLQQRLRYEARNARKDS